MLKTHMQDGYRMIALCGLRHTHRRIVEGRWIYPGAPGKVTCQACNKVLRRLGFRKGGGA